MFFYNATTFTPNDSFKIDHHRVSKVFRSFLRIFDQGPQTIKGAFAVGLVLDHLYQACAVSGIQNIIRLAVDEDDLYFDNHGIDHDFSDTLSHFSDSEKANHIANFKFLTLVLEHRTAEFHVLIRIRINRFPDEIHEAVTLGTFGLFPEFQVTDSKEAIIDALDHTMSDQQQYNAFLERKQKAFGTFVLKLVAEIKKAFSLKDFNSRASTILMRPNPRTEERDPKSKPLFQEFYNWDRYGFYCSEWLNRMQQHPIQVSHVVLVNPFGDPIHRIGAIPSSVINDPCFNMALPFDGRLFSTLEDEVLHPPSSYEDSLYDALGINSVSDASGRTNPAYIVLEGINIALLIGKHGEWAPIYYEKQENNAERDYYLGSTDGSSRS